MSFSNKEYQKMYYQRISLKKPPKITFGKETFQTIDSFKKYVNSVIKENLDINIKQDHKIYDFCLLVYQRHPDFDGTIPSEFHFVTQNTSSRSPSLSKELYRGETYRPHYRGEDNRWHTFSITKCITGKDQSYTQKLLAAMRNEVNNDILEHRRSKPYCIKCKCSDMSKLDVDHTGEKEFRDIAQMFIDLLEGTGPEPNIKLSTGPIEFYKEGVKLMFEDRNLAVIWKELHKDEALFQTLCKDCHKAKTYNK
jgi:hypothetical protein